MNNYFSFLIIAIFFHSSIFCQFTVLEDSVYAESNVNEDDIVVYNKHFGSQTPITVKWRIYDIDVPNNWENDIFVCDAVLCWDSTKNNNEYTLTNSDEEPFDVHFLNNGNSGDANAQLLIWQVGDSLNTFKIIKYTSKVEEGVSISEVVNSLDLVYPNPVINYLVINNADALDYSYLIISDILSKNILQHQIISNKTELDISGLKSGLYFIRLYNNNGNLKYTKKITKM